MAEKLCTAKEKLIKNILVLKNDIKSNVRNQMSNIEKIMKENALKYKKKLKTKKQNIMGIQNNLKDIQVSLQSELREKKERQKELFLEYFKKIALKLSNLTSKSKSNAQGNSVKLVINLNPIHEIIQFLRNNAKQVLETMHTESQLFSKEIQILKEDMNKLKTKVDTKSDKPDEKLKYVREILYLTKTIIPAEKERLAILKAKNDKVAVFASIFTEYKDAKNTKDVTKIRAVTAKHWTSFPYLKIFDIKADIKFLSACLEKIVEHKSGKAKQYNDQINACNVLLKAADKSYNTYNKILAEMQKK